jgi:hypothetical protein
VVSEHLPSPLVGFALGDDAVAGSFESEVEPADAAEQ